MQTCEAGDSYKRIKSAHTVARVMEFLSERRGPASPGDIADGIDCPKGTVMCVLKSLEDYDFVRQVGGHYELGMKVGLLWARMKARLESEMTIINQALRALNVGGNNGQG